MNQTLIATIAQLLDARRSCLERNNVEWLQEHTDRLRAIARELLPRGSGIDNGTTIDLDRSRRDRIVLSTSFHHMTAEGMYATWTDHDLIVRPSFGGIDVRITGRDRNGIKDYLAELFDDVLSRSVSWNVPAGAYDFDIIRSHYAGRSWFPAGQELEAPKSVDDRIVVTRVTF